jgi:hypothetical protein
MQGRKNTNALAYFGLALLTKKKKKFGDLDTEADVGDACQRLANMYLKGFKDAVQGPML